MTLPKFIYPPEQANYSVTDGQETITVQLEGGESRSRIDILNSSSIVDASWLLGPAAYEYWRAWYKSSEHGNKGANWFLLDLLLDEAYGLTEHEVKFVPGSVKLSRTAGYSYRMSAQLEVRPIIYPAGYYDAIIMLYEEFGDDAAEEGEEYFNLLANLVTVVMPGTEVFGG